MTRHDPTIYAGLMEHALRDPLPALREYFDQSWRGYSSGMYEDMLEQLRKAYVAGVCDGFAQGVAAESERRDEIDRVLPRAGA